jgi:protein-ribulosamine 3-kinase
MSPRALEAAVREALRDPEASVTGVHPAGGGCIHNAARISTTAGDVFVKWNDDCPPDLFLREADGLRELRAAGSELTIPEVLRAAPPEGDAPALIVMEYLPPSSGRGGRDDETLGRGLAAIHRRRAQTFGFATPSYCGPTRQDNTPCASWVEFYGERRLRALVRLLEEQRKIGPGERRTYERLVGRLSELLPPGPEPSLVHGDLWSGNVLSTARGPALFDPAVAYADREMEFGITTLFGGFSSRFFEAYEEAWPLPAGWRDRNPIYQLYHLLNHFLIFGGHYGPQALSVALRYV